MLGLVGRSMDMVDNRIECIRILKHAVLMDYRCLEAAEYLSCKSLLSSAQKRELFLMTKSAHQLNGIWEKNYK